MNLHEKACEAITEYVNNHGIAQMTRHEVLEIIHAKYSEIKLSGDSVSPSDICYNRCNGKRMKKNFGNWPHALEFLGDAKYRLLGNNYNYTGNVINKPKKRDIEAIILGSWFNGVFREFPLEQQVQEEEYNAKKENYIREVDKIYGRKNIEGWERQALIKARVNQGVFREALLNRYDSCCLCGVSNQSLLVASHIKPWRNCDSYEKTDVNNGLLLCPNHDKLFDSGLVSFSDDGKMLISKNLSEKDAVMLKVNQSMKIEVCDENKKYLKFHRENIFQD